jgi:hypothetical protein
MVLSSMSPEEDYYDLTDHDRLRICDASTQYDGAVLIAVDARERDLSGPTMTDTQTPPGQTAQAPPGQNLTGDIATTRHPPLHVTLRQELEARLVCGVPRETNGVRIL